MNATALKLLTSVKTVVAQYGLEGLSTRIIGDVAGVNDALIYRYFKDKANLLQQAYDYESNSIFNAMMGYLKEVHGIPFSFRDKARLAFHRVWLELLSDHDRLIFVTTYYHSFNFSYSDVCHQTQVQRLEKHLGRYFPDETACVQTMYLMLSILCDTTMRAKGESPAVQEEMEERTFTMCYAILTLQMTELSPC